MLRMPAAAGTSSPHLAPLLAETYAVCLQVPPIVEEVAW